MISVGIKEFVFERDTWIIAMEIACVVDGCLAGMLGCHFAKTVAASSTHGVEDYNGDSHHRHADRVDHYRLVGQCCISIAPAHRMPQY